MLCLSFGIEMIPNLVIILANLEAAWLFYVLRGSITSYGHSETNLTRLAGFQIIMSVGMAFVCLYLSRRQSKYDFQKLAFGATASSIMGLCAAVVGAYPFLIGKTISP